jgi:uncharacterized SAM-binding protein YcdF (DUF218 family)
VFAASDAVIVIFGAAVRPGGQPSMTLCRRVEAALACARQFGDPIFLPTGGVGRYGPSEASVMAGLLRQSGVPRDRILLEESGTDTLSSVRAVARMLRDRIVTEAPGMPLFVATHGYHLPRCLMLLKLAGITARPCRPPPPAAFFWQRWYWRLREVPAIPYDAVLSLLMRVLGQ